MSKVAVDEVGDVEQELLIDDGAVAPLKTSFRWTWMRISFLSTLLACGLLSLHFLRADVKSTGGSSVMQLDGVNSILHYVSIQPYGVLGVQLDSLHHYVRQAPEPWGLTAIVDPAGLRFVHDLGPAGAGGASQAIYSWLRINLDARFPSDVRDGIQNECDAKMHQYGEKQVIHVVGPDFSQVPWASGQAQQTALQKLTLAYKNILVEFEASTSQRLRLLPVSGGIFSGPFHQQLPHLTFEALEKAFRSLPESSQEHLLQRFKDHVLEMCIFQESDLPSYEAACASCV